MADGRVTIDTRIDEKGAINGMNTLENKVKVPLKRIAGLIAVAFSVKAIANFAKESESLYKTQMTNEVKLATVMKQRMNASEKEIQQVKDLASEQQKLGIIGDEVQLAGAQQIATFVNQKESLDKLIPAMNNLVAQQYGYSATAESAKNIGNLFGKAMQGQTSALRRVGITFSEAEENILKYGNEEQRASMLAQVITNNVGEMNKALANTPLGRQQQLSNTVGDIKENFGQAYVNIKALFLPALNSLASVANRVSLAFVGISKSLAEVFGIDISGAKELESSISEQADDSTTLSDGMEDVAQNTKKASKEAKKGTRAFDELVNLSSGTSSDGGTSASASASNKGSKGKGTNDTKETSSIIDSLKTKLESLRGMLGNFFQTDSLGQSMATFGKEVITFLKTMVKSFASIGQSIGKNLLGGIQGYFKNNSGYIKTNLIDMFSSLTTIIKNWESLLDAIANVFEVFESPEAQSVTTSMIEIFANGYIGSKNVMLKLSRDVSTLLTKPFVDNQDKIKTALENIITILDPIMQTIADTVTETWTTINQAYDQYIAPSFAMITSAISSLVDTVLTAFNDTIAPVLIDIGKDFQSVWTSYVQPVINKAIVIVGKVVEVISLLFSNVIVPFVNYLIQKFAPYVAGVIKGIWEVAKGIIKGLSERINAFLGVLNSVLTFLKDVFTGNWSKLWGDVKGIFASIFNLIKAEIKGFWEVVKGIVSGIASRFSGLWDSIKLIFDLDKVGKFFTDVCGAITGAFGGIATWFKNTFSKAWQSVKDVFSSGGEVFDGIKDGIINGLSSVINKLIDGINKVIAVPFNAINKAIEKLKGIDILGIKPFDWIGTIDVPKIPSIPLATGAVLPPNKPFLATVGDQKHGTNVEAPLDTIVQAMNIALANRSGGNENIVVQIDGEAVFKAVRNQSDNYTRRTGNSAFAY